MTKLLLLLGIVDQMNLLKRMNLLLSLTKMKKKRRVTIDLRLEGDLVQEQSLWSLRGVRQQ
jgi:hypothetical protein